MRGNQQGVEVDGPTSGVTGMTELGQARHETRGYVAGARSEGGLDYPYGRWDPPPRLASTPRVGDVDKYPSGV